MKKLLLLSFIMCSAFTAQADIFKYISPDGHLYMTDHALDDSYRLIKKTVTSFSNNENATYKQNIKTFSPHIKTAAMKYKLDPKLIHAIVDTESAFNPKAYSKAGAIGLMQLMPETAKSLGVKNSWDAKQNIQGGTYYFRQLMDKYGQNIKLSLAAYNAGESAVKHAGNAIPNYPETIRYVKKVIQRYTKLKQPS